MVVSLGRPLAFLLLASLTLSGCASSSTSSSAPGANQAAEELDLEATKDTGVIRGIVVDTGVRPITNALVSVRSAAKTVTTNTTSSGAFGFQGLEPGTYFVKASKLGFLEGQTSVEVVAGVSDPPVTRLTLAEDAKTAPFVQPVVSKGFLECSWNAVVVGLAMCSTLGLPNDVFLFSIPVVRRPDQMQSEMIWESTQQAGDALELLWSYDCGAALLCNFEAAGVSPQLLVSNVTILDTLNVGNGTDLLMRVFPHWIDGTAPPSPVSDQCMDVPALGQRCTNRGVGVVLEQPFEIYSHFFFGYTPPEWRISSGTPVPQPPK